MSILSRAVTNHFISSSIDLTILVKKKKKKSESRGQIAFSYSTNSPNSKTSNVLTHQRKKEKLQIFTFEKQEPGWMFDFFFFARIEA